MALFCSGCYNYLYTLETSTPCRWNARDTALLPIQSSNENRWDREVFPWQGRVGEILPVPHVPTEVVQDVRRVGLKAYVKKLLGLGVERGRKNAQSRLESPKNGVGHTPARGIKPAS